jgi:hypothetical protein
MKVLIESLAKYDMIFKDIDKVNLKQLKIKTKVDIYKATSVNGDYCSIFEINKKSRFLKKDSSKLLNINEDLKNHYEHNFAKSFLYISSPLCSKAKEMLENEKWIIIKQEI